MAWPLLPASAGAPGSRLCGLRQACQLVGAVGTVNTINGTPGISALTGTALLVSTVNDTFNVRAVTLTKAFAPTPVAVNAASLLTFSLTNGVGNPAQGGTTPVNNLLAFTETLPAGVGDASAPAALRCNDTVAATVGTGVITFGGGTLSLDKPAVQFWSMSCRPPQEPTTTCQPM